MVETLQNTIYVTGLSSEDTRRVRDDFLAYPFPGWHLELLDAGAAPPINLLAGQAILVIGCGGVPPGHAEAMWLLRLFACGCPWVAVVSDSSGPTHEACEAAGAAAYVTRPFDPARLRERIWHDAVPHAGAPTVLPLTCDRLVRYMSVLRADVLLKFTAATGRAGYLALKGGQPVHATVVDGPDGAAGLRDILNWGRGKVLGLPIPTILPQNLPDRPEAWVDLLRPIGRQPGLGHRAVPGGPEACDRVVQELPDVRSCALIDIRSGRIMAYPTSAPRPSDSDARFASAAADLLKAPIHAVDADLTAETLEEFVVLGANGWSAVARLPGGRLALVVSAEGPAHLGLARQVFVAAAAELEWRSGMAVQEAGVG